MGCAWSPRLAEVLVQGTTCPCGPGRWAQGLGCGRAWRGREARACAAGTWALAPEQIRVAPRIPRIPARPRFCRHVVARRAALTVRLREGAHSRLRSACDLPGCGTWTQGPATVPCWSTPAV